MQSKQILSCGRIFPGGFKKKQSYPTDSGSFLDQSSLFSREIYIDICIALLSRKPFTLLFSSNSLAMILSISGRTSSTGNCLAASIFSILLYTMRTFLELPIDPFDFCSSRFTLKGCRISWSFNENAFFSNG